MKGILFSTSANSKLAKALAKNTRLRFGKYKLGRFVDQEIRLELQESVKGKRVYAIGSTFPPAEHLLELLILINTLKLNGAREVIAIVPYFGYSRSDHQYISGSPINARLMAHLIEAAGAQKTITINLHGKTATFFRRPLIHLDAIPYLAQEIRKMRIQDLAVACPDKGGIPLAKKFAKILGVRDVIISEKQHPTPEQTVVKKIIGHPKNKNIVLVDDMIQSGGTIIEAADKLKKLGAKKIYVAVTHLISTGPAVQKLMRAKSIAKVIITNTIPRKNAPKKIRSVPIDDLLAGAM
jgi:ribose-phosphate pyrophosphokinase